MPPRNRKPAQPKEINEMTAVQEEEATSVRKYKDLSPEALGVTEDNFADYEGELPKQSAANEKYRVYYDELMDSYTRGVNKRVRGVENPQDLVNALRNAASNNGIGIDTRIIDGDVYFRGREKRAKKPSQSTV